MTGPRKTFYVGVGLIVIVGTILFGGTVQTGNSIEIFGFCFGRGKSQRMGRGESLFWGAAPIVGGGRSGSEHLLRSSSPRDPKMPFPISARGTLIANTASVEQALRTMETILREEAPSTICMGEAQLSFRVSVFRPLARRNLLNAISAGNFAFARRNGSVEIRYRIWLLHNIVALTVALLLIGLSTHSFLVAGVVCIFLFTVIYAATIPRFPTALQERLNESLRREASLGR
jgi:hypothetical protein